ncbi:MAG: hypothetical protein L0H41_17860, partial [Microlunatus sp.]|nr:hypothetical protein [Microlunatus sp.]
MTKLIAGVVTMVLVVVVALVFFGSPKPPCLPDPVSLGDGGIDVPADPVPVSNPSAPLTARVASWNTLRSNSTGRVLRGVASIAGSS